jgi:hypothetical protein
VNISYIRAWLICIVYFTCLFSTEAVSAAEVNEFNRLQALAVAAQNAPPTEQASRWKEFLSQISSFAQENPTLDIWMLRAAASLAIDDELSGKEAAAKLAALGALNSNDALLRKLMANLVLKGWTASAESQTKPAESHAVTLHCCPK